MSNEYWWMNGSWREREPIARFIKDMSSSDDSKHDNLVRYFNPTCTHERTSYGIMNCDACASYTKLLLAGEAAEYTPCK